MRQIFKSISILLLFIMCAGSVSAKKKNETIIIKQGNPLIILQDKKAIFEIDYSKMMVLPDKKDEDSMPFREWMISQDEDNEKWIRDWEEKDSAECRRAFRDYFNDEIKHGIKLTRLGKDYKVTLRIDEIYIGKHAKGGRIALGIILGGAAALNANRNKAIASGELQIQNLQTGEIELIIEFKNLVGEESLSQIGRIKGIFENLSEQINEYLEDYQKESKKQEKEQEKLRKKELKKQKKNLD